MLALGMAATGRGPRLFNLVRQRSHAFAYLAPGRAAICAFEPYIGNRSVGGCADIAATSQRLRRSRQKRSTGRPRPAFGGAAIVTQLAPVSAVGHTVTVPSAY